MNITDNPRYRLSIIIPCLNEEQYVEKILADLESQNTAHKFEVIVVDSGSADKTAEAALKHQEKLDLRVVRLTQRGVSLARNSGAAAAKGAWLFFIDADIRLSNDFVADVMSELTNHDADFGTCSIAINSWHPFDKLFHLLWNLSFRLAFKRKKYLMTGAAIFVKHYLHNQINGFNEDMIIGEDLDYTRRLTAINNNGLFVNKKVKMSNRRSIHDGRIKLFFRGIGWTLNLPPGYYRLINSGYFDNRNTTPRLRKITRFGIYLLIIAATTHLLIAIVS